jgi:hypothetical protein
VLVTFAEPLRLVLFVLCLLLLLGFFGLTLFAAFAERHKLWRWSPYHKIHSQEIQVHRYVIHEKTLTGYNICFRLSVHFYIADRREYRHGHRRTPGLPNLARGL